MYFGLNWDDKKPEGYVVTITQVWPEDGLLKAKPLRKFKEQGDAKVYQLHDCHNLTEMDIKFLTKTYNRSRLYIRISEKHFRYIH